MKGREGIIEIMNIKEKLQQSLKDALKSGQVMRKSTLRLALAEIKNAEVREQRDLKDAEMLGILQKEVKARQETIEGAQQAGREDLIQKAEQEIEILHEFLPEPMTEEELRQIVRETITEVGAASLAEMGQVMGALMPKIRGKADGKEANQLVREELQGG